MASTMATWKGLIWVWQVPVELVFSCKGAGHVNHSKKAGQGNYNDLSNMVVYGDNVGYTMQ